jgi:hypothetical protein
MVAEIGKLPEDFVPFARLNVCGNVMSAGKAPFVVGEKIPLLVGKNAHPKLWLSAPQNLAATDWIELIAAGKPLQPEVKVFTSDDQKDVTVQVRRQPILELHIVSPDHAELSFIDLRPIGLNIFGENNVLHLGTNTFLNNSFKNVPYMVKLG